MQSAASVSSGHCRNADEFLTFVPTFENAALSCNGLVLLASWCAVTVELFADRRSAVGWLDKERPVLLADVDQEARHGCGEHGFQPAATLELHALEGYRAVHGRYLEANALIGRPVWDGGLARRDRP
ncbi:hypothetical protein [Streptomyces sp. NPDC020362]|uniref:hypothetical protein n=1 Tax=unclassified Streptomyces TaxID=2593676 RepID=UPI003408BDDD